MRAVKGLMKVERDEDDVVDGDGVQTEAQERMNECNYTWIYIFNNID